MRGNRRDFRGLAVLLILAVAVFGQTLVDVRAASEGGSATYCPPITIRPPVAGAPVSYGLHEVRVQMLADGAQTTHSTQQQRFWRDSQGRTRTDQFTSTVWSMKRIRQYRHGVRPRSSIPCRDSGTCWIRKTRSRTAWTLADANASLATPAPT